MKMLLLLLPCNKRSILNLISPAKNTVYQTFLNKLHLHGVIYRHVDITCAITAAKVQGIAFVLVRFSADPAL